MVCDIPMIPIFYPDRKSFSEENLGKFRVCKWIVAKPLKRRMIIPFCALTGSRVAGRFF